MARDLDCEEIFYDSGMTNRNAVTKLDDVKNESVLLCTVRINKDRTHFSAFLIILFDKFSRYCKIEASIYLLSIHLPTEKPTENTTHSKREVSIERYFQYVTNDA